MVPGHEIAGIVESVGDGVTKFKVGPSSGSRGSGLVWFFGGCFLCAVWGLSGLFWGDGVALLDFSKIGGKQVLFSSFAFFLRISFCLEFEAFRESLSLQGPMHVIPRRSRSQAPADRLSTRKPNPNQLETIQNTNKDYKKSF